MEFLTLGTSLTSENVVKYAAVGAPKRHGQSGGAVYIYEIGGSGSADGELGSLVQTLVSPDSSRAVDFGWALLSADVTDCRQDPTTGYWWGCGEELLVSAPGTAHEGQVYVFEHRAIPSNVLLHHVATVASSASTTGDRFGYSLAATKREAYISGVPWNAAPDVPVLVAVGAPGYPSDGLVEWYQSGPTPTSPLVTVHVTGGVHAAPCGNSSVGWSVAVGDWNSDGRPDVAYSRPNIGSTASTPCRGVVYVQLGTYGGGGYPGGTLHAVLSYDGTDDPYDTSYEDRFGFAIESGFAHLDRGTLIDDPSDDALVEVLLVGAPQVAAGGGTWGGIAEYRWARNSFTPSPNYRSTHLNPDFDPSLSGLLSSYGHAVSVGNFAATDDLEGWESLVARQREVAVGDPLTGQVTVHRADDTAIRSTPYTTLTSARSEFGHALAEGHGQRDLANGHYQSHWEDLLIGAPGEASHSGALELTEASQPASCDEANGYWTNSTSTADPPDIFVSTTDDGNWTHILFLKDYPIEVQDSDGNVCQISTAGDTADTDTDTDSALLDDYLPAGSIIEVPAGWVCGGPSLQGHSAVPADRVFAFIAEANGATCTTLPGETVGVWLHWLPSPETLWLLLDISSLSHRKLDMDASCQVVPLDPFYRVDSVCE